MISSCTGGAEMVLVPSLAVFDVLLPRVTSTDTDTTSAMAARIAVTPTIHGHRGGLTSSYSVTPS